MNNNIDITVCCITYNQEKYLRQCLDGIFMQKGTLNIEVLIHDDASTDNTINIIREYENKYNNLIPILQSENQYSKGKRILTNFLYPRAKGKYIALCEGDDYWTDPYKLQKQYDFMEAHDEVSMIFHDSRVVNVDGVEVVECPHRYKQSQYALFNDLIIYGGWFCPTASLFFRAKYVKEDYPDFCKNCHVGDFPLQLYLGTKGKIYYFVDKMAVYRFKVPGSWTETFFKLNTVSDKQIKNWKSELNMLDGISSLVDNQYKRSIQNKKTNFIIHHILVDHLKNAKTLAKEFNSEIKQLMIIDRGLIYIIKKFNFENLSTSYIFLIRVRNKLDRIFSKK